MSVRLLMFFLLAAPAFSFAAPQVGDPAPEFSLQGSDGNSYSLGELKGKGGIVIAFFPKAFTGG